MTKAHHTQSVSPGHTCDLMEGHRAVGIQCYKSVASLIEDAVSAVKSRNITDTSLMEGSR